MSAGQTPTPCEACGAALESRLVCEQCGVLQTPDSAPDPFEALGLPRAYPLDAGQLAKRLVRLTRRVHPDFFATEEPAVRALAERWSAELNSAHRRLESPATRAELLLELGHGPSQDEERQMPQEFLMEVLEWNETLEAARDALAGPERHALLEPLRAELERQRESLFEDIGTLLVPLPENGAPAYTELRRRLNGVRYTDRALDEIRELDLERA